MTVYVDDMRARRGRLIFCHMIADSDDELYSMVDLIGVNRRWVQVGPHFDVCLVKRSLAVDSGAFEITQRQCAAMVARRRETGSLGDPGDAIQWFRHRRSNDIERLV